MLSDIKIRKAMPEDLPTIARLEKECFKTDAFNKDLISYLYEIEPEGCFIAEYKGGIVGYAIFSTRGLDNIVTIAVQENYRRKGVGTELLKAGISYLKTKRISKIVLHVKKTNKGAIAFYKHHGFRERGYSHRYYQDGEDAIIMIKEL